MRKYIVLSFAAFGMLSLSSLRASAALDDIDRSFDLVNHSRQTVDSVRISNIDDDSWGPNLLDGDTIAPWGFLKLQPFQSLGYCRFNIKVDFQNGSSETISDVNLCEANKVVVHAPARVEY
jgi:hypothetical protein